MNKHHKLYEAIIISFLFISLTIISLILLKSAFPNEFNSLTGKAISASSVNVTESISNGCNFTIHPGWNYLSFFCLSTWQDREDFLEALSDYTVIYFYDSGDSNDPWKVYKTGLPDSVIYDLDHFSRRNGYIFYFNKANSENIYYNGSKRIPTSVSLKSGWNLVGFPTNIPKNITLALNSTNENYNLIISLNNTNKIYENYKPGIGGNLSYMKPYRAYWINMTSSETWVVNW